MEKFLLDANIILGLLNRNDQHHEKCLNFFKEIDMKYREGIKVQGIVPAHLMIEVNLKIIRKRADKTWDGIPPLQIMGPILYPIDQGLLERVQQKGLYDKFSTLKPPDAIYAMVAFLEKIPLVTLDSDFDRVKEIIDVKIL